MKIYCSGIGGIGLSAYAALQSAKGHEVLGSDRELTPLTQDLEGQGIRVFDVQDGFCIPDDIDLFVYSEAIPEDAPERVRAKELGVLQQSYFEALGNLGSEFKTVIAVCGTHGKSTTTAMAAKLLVDAGLDPTVVVGTKVPQLDGRNWRKGSGELFLVEACEYKGNFLHISPTTILITNCDGDHFDVFDSVEQYQETFVQFLKKLPAAGKVITHMQDSDCEKVVRGAGLEKRTIAADKTIALPDIRLSVPGRHMVDNAILVHALAEELGIDLATVQVSLENFTGTWRRMEEKGRMPNGAIVVDDYAHHPREVVATVAATIQKYPDAKRLICLFQPHMNNRVKRLYDDFLVAFRGLDEIIFTDIYDARVEADELTVDVQKFANGVGNCIYKRTLEEAETYCREHVKKGDVLLVMGAGDVTNVAENLVKA